MLTQWQKDKIRLFLVNFNSEIDITQLQNLVKGKVIKTVWYWQEKRKIEQWNGTDHLEIDSHKYRQLTFDKVKIVQRRMDALHQSAETTGRSHAKS